MPYWASALFWPLVASSQKGFHKFVKGYKFFDCGLKQGKHTGVIGSKEFKSKVLAMRLSFTEL